jgi:hypothetical protein
MPKIAMHGTTMGRGPYRSSSLPSIGEHTATVIAAIPKAVEMLSRLHPNSVLSGFKNTPKVNTNSDPKLTVTPQNAASTTSHSERVPSRSGA